MIDFEGSFVSTNFVDIYEKKNSFLDKKIKLNVELKGLLLIFRLFFSNKA